jgi:hypothetical protein
MMNKPVGRYKIESIARFILALELIVLILAAISGCSPSDKRLVGTWRCEPRTTGAISYTFASDGTYYEKYIIGDTAGSTGMIRGTWSFGYTDDSKPGISLKAKEDPCAGGMLPYRFDGNDRLVLGDKTLVRERSTSKY